jgi:hypothetical protein
VKRLPARLQRRKVSVFGNGQYFATTGPPNR